MMFATLLVLAACALCASQGSTLIQTRIAMASADAVDDGSMQLDDEIATLSNLAQSAGSNGAGSLALTTAKKITETMLYHAGNATQHLNSAQQTELQTVIDLLNATLFASMDVGHNEDQQELNDAAAEVALVNEEIVSRLASTGDIGRIQALARSLQTNITNSQDDLNRKTATKKLTWKALNDFMQQIGESPACPSLPASKTMLTLDNFFASNAYAVWYADKKATYDPKRAAFETASTALASLVDQLTSTRTSLQAEYCDWKLLLESGCTKFDADYMKNSDEFGVVKGRVQNAMQSRIDMYKAGKIIVAHIKHLLGSAVFDENFKVTDTSRYELSIPTQQPKGPCSLTALTASHWDPPISCPQSPGADVVACEHVGHRTNPMCMLPQEAVCHGNVKYGYGSKWIQKTFHGVFECSNEVFGDPDVGQAKECKCIKEDVVACEHVGHSTNPMCTLPNEAVCHGNVKYGYGSKWIQKTFHGVFECSNEVFGDPDVGQAKECRCEYSANIVDHYCVSIVTGSESNNQGTIDVSIRTGDMMVHVVSDSFAQGDVVVDKCYSDPISALYMHNPSNDAWAGSIQYSTNARETFDAMVCSSGCNSVSSTSSIVFDGNHDGSNQASLSCLGGEVCRMTETLTVACCMAMTSTCLSCTAGMTEQEYCMQNPGTAGCITQVL